MLSNPISYVTTDIELTSSQDLGAVVAALGEVFLAYENSWIGDRYQVRLGFADCDPSTPEAQLTLYCDLLEGLEPVHRDRLRHAERAVVDLGFESGTEPDAVAYEVPRALLQRLSNLGFGVVVTIYKVGMYSQAP